MKHSQGNERRKYLRISTVFPVEFVLIDDQGQKITPWLQGFTSNIGKGGICLEVNDLWWGFWDRLRLGMNVKITLQVPLRKKDITATAQIVWRKRERREHFSRCLCGLEFIGIEKKQKRSLFRYALWKKGVPLVTGICIIALFATSSFLFIQQTRLARENKRILSQYFRVVKEGSSLKNALDAEKKLLEYFQQQQQDLEGKLRELNQQLVVWEGKYEQIRSQKEVAVLQPDIQSQLQAKIEGLQKRIQTLSHDNEALKSRLLEKEKLTTRLSQDIEAKERQKQYYTSRIISGMYQWISSRQDLRTGLVLSYEGDESLTRVAFSYDQALAAITFLISGEPERTERILAFYLDRIGQNQNIYNAYYTNGDVFEYVIHAGPNAWVGLAALHYVELTGDTRYLKIAEEVSRLLLDLMDSEGGIKGGPDVTWYSTEHNLDASAFFKLLARVTGDQRYNRYGRRVDKWLDRYAYTHHPVPINRGRGDATIATDTYTWSITALGPETLREYNMDPEEIIEFAVKHCEVDVTFRRGDDAVAVTGFDFAKAQHIARGGVVSGEWTAQMILALQILADDYRPRDTTKARFYFERARFYFEELQKMVINSPSAVGKAYPTLPYASQSFADTGHGWRTPEGDRVGSLAATAYFLISYRGFNPLGGGFLDVSLRSIYEGSDYRADAGTR